MRTHSTFAILIFTGAALLTACNGATEQPAAAAHPVAVRVVTAGYENVPDYVEAPGSVQPRNRTSLSAQINGFVHDVMVRAGDSVRAGQTLATLDAREADSQKAAAEAAVTEARAALDEARNSAGMAANMRDAAKAAAVLANGTYDRYQKLFAAKSVSPQELDEVKARRDATAADLAAKETMVAAAQDRLRQIQARIEQANAQAGRADVMVSWTVIKAPAAGRVAERLVDPGSAIFPGSPLLVLESTVNSQVLADIPTNQSSHLRPGLEVQVGDPAAPDVLIKGRVSEIVPLSNPGSHTMQFKVDLPAGFSATAGRFFKVLVPTGTRQALLVPRAAMRETGQLTGVFVVDGSSVARFRLVRSSDYDTERMELLSGIDPGEKIVADPGSDIVDGTRLEVRQ